RRAGQARWRPTPPTLAGVAALHGCGPLRLHRRDRRIHEHGPPVWLGSQGRAPGRCGPPWPLAHDDLRRWRAGERIIAPFGLDGPMTGEAFRAYVEQVLAPE